MSERAARWIRLVLEFAVNQGITQAAGMMSGLIYVRLMPVDQYALYAVGLTTLTFISMGSDLGLTGSIGYFWRQRLIGGSPVEPVIAAVRRLRSVLLIFASVVCSVFLLKTAVTQNLPVTTVVACFGLAVATAWSQTRTSIDLAIMRIEGMQRQSYYCEAAGSITRLLGACAMIVTRISTAVFGLVGGLLGSFAVVIFIRSMASVPANSLQPIGRETWREVLAYVRPMFPTMVVYMVQDPLIYWLTLTFGGEGPVSESFAVGRIAAIYGLLGNFIVTAVVPRLTCITDEAHLARMTAFILVVLVLLCLVALIGTYLAPSVLLLLIGAKYSHLHREVVLSIASASFGMLVTFLAVVNRLQGWVRLEPVVALCQVVAIFVLASRWSFHESASVLGLMVVLAGFSFLGAFITSVVGLLEPRIVKSH
jgi:hypothetical protein